MTAQVQLTIDHRDELVDAAMRLLERQLPAEPIVNVWPEQHRILFRTADGRIGDVEVFINWDALTESTGVGKGTP